MGFSRQLARHVSMRAVFRIGLLAAGAATATACSAGGNRATRCTSTTPPSSETSVNAALVDAECAAIQKKEHAALDALATKGVDKAAIAQAKNRIGKCMKLNGAALVLSIEGLRSALPPPQDPVCSDVGVHP